MKLINKPKVSVDVITHNKYSFKSTLREILTLGLCKPTKSDITETHVYPGLTTISNMVVDFEVPTESTKMIGLKLDCLLLDGKIMFGVMPITHLHDNVYECTVDHLK